MKTISTYNKNQTNQNYSISTWNFNVIKFPTLTSCYIKYRDYLVSYKIAKGKAGCFGSLECYSEIVKNFPNLSEHVDGIRCLSCFVSDCN